ncbi:uncharacterized protein [Amphiura filiformis]|uniref:uncharacterized protein n=1 Tax=Amphiura filiformis TaxID=82378 RepID=UPI003B2175B4
MKMASEDNDASVIVRSRVDLSQGHTYGPFKGRVKPLPEDGELPFGAWKIYCGPEEPVKTFASNDASLPNWLRFIKSTEDESQQNVILVEQGKKFYFEVTRDMPKGEEYFLMGRRIEEPPPPPVKEPPTAIEPGKEPPASIVPGKKRGPGRPPKKYLTPEEQELQNVLKEAHAQASLSGRGRSRKCTLCAKTFTSSVLFMQHRQECAVIKNTEEEEDDDDDEEEDELDEEGGEDEEEGDEENSIKEEQELIEEEGNSQGSTEVFGETSEVKDIQSTSQPQPVRAPVKRSWPSGAKRPVGRPRKDGRPPIPRKKRRGRRKRKRVDDDEDFPGRSVKIQKDECIPTVEDAEKFPFKCEVCEKIFSTKTWHDLHRVQHDSPLLTYLVCALCDEAFKFLTEYNNHMDELHPNLGKRERVLSNKFRCEDCKKSFRSPIHMERHKRRAAAEEPLPKGPVQVKCKYCEKSFSMEQGLMNHTLRYHPEHRRFQCTANDCMESFDEKDERAMHLEEVHKLDPKQIYKCPVDLCDKAYTTMTALNYHYELQHTTTSRPFTCELCGKAWVKIGKLREHLKTHSTEKNELCDECGRAFKSRPELKDHKMEMHTEAGREKLNCRYCSATFSRRSSRSYHERRHRNDTPYICPKPGCNKGFIAVIDYKRHLIFHTGAKLYRCRYCSNCFTRSDYLKGHEKKHHAKGEMVDVGPPIEETVTIKVPWPMEKAVKIQGQNVVVIIEPDPTLADASMAADAIAALDGMHSIESETSIQVRHSVNDVVNEEWDQRVVVIIEPDPTLVDASMAADAIAALDGMHSIESETSIQVRHSVNDVVNEGWDQRVVVIIEPDPTLADASMAADAIAALDGMHSIESETSIQVRHSVNDVVNEEWDQRVVVIIEPDPTLADASMAADAIAALDGMHSIESETSIQIPVQDSSERISDQLVTAVVASDGTGDIIQQAAQQAIQQTAGGTTQLIQIPTNAEQQAITCMDTSASAAMQQAVAQAAMAAAAAASSTVSNVTTSVADTTQQIFLQTSASMDGTETMLQVQQAEEVSLEGATSEQAAIKMAIQQLASDGTHVVLQPATAQHTEMGTTMQATLQGEDGQTQIVMVNLAPGTVLTDEDGNVSVTSGMTTDGVITMTAANADQEVTDTTDVGEDRTVAIAIQHGEDVSYVLEESDSQEVAIAAAQMEAETEQMNAETEGEIPQQQVVTTEESEVAEAVTTIAYSDISHTLTTV